VTKYIYFESTDSIYSKFDNYEIHPCIVISADENGVIYEQCGFEERNIAIWCVYGHYIPSRNIGGLECLSDHDTLKEAREFFDNLPLLSIDG